MKHFFHSKLNNNGGLLQNIFHDYLTKNISEQLKILYDAADIIHDKRLPDEDKELKAFLQAGDNNNPEFPERIWVCPRNHALLEQLKCSYTSPALGADASKCETITFSHNSKDYKLYALLALWNEAERKHNCMHEGDPLGCALFHLCRGNICLRISQHYYGIKHDYDNSDKWADRAIEIIWHGKIIAEQNSDFYEANSKEHSLLNIYLFLMKLNLATYYLDYARKNRRSSYSNAKEELNTIIENIQRLFEIPSTIPSCIEQRRQYGLIYAESKCALIAIYRRQYDTTNALKSCESLYKSLKAVNKEDPYNSDSQVAILSNLCISSEKNAKALYDLKRYMLIATLDFARVHRDQHEPKHYFEAIILAEEANELSQQLDDYANPHDNLDAIIILSSSYRKTIKYSENSEQVVNRIDNWKSTDNVEKRSLFSTLKELADQNHIGATAELIKWYCMALYEDDKNLSELLAREEWMTFETIQRYLEEGIPNPQQQFLKGMVLLYSDKYSDAIRVFQQLLNENEKETNYIRFGTIGIKTRYLMAKAYMSLGDFSEARIILTKISETLKEVRRSRLAQNKQSVIDSAQIRTTDADTDLRVMIDLIYCYMQQGNYVQGYKMYEEYYNEVCMVEEVQPSNNSIFVDENFLSKIKKQRRIAGINNLISCCIFSINDKDYASHNTTNNEQINVAKKKEDEEQILLRIEITKYLRTAVNAFIYLDKKYGKVLTGRNCPEYVDNPETNLLRGYFILLTGQEHADLDDESIDTVVDNLFYNRKTIQTTDILKAAQEYFKLACGYKSGFSPVYTLFPEDNDSNKAALGNHVDYISAYLINLLRLCKMDEDNKLQYSDEIKRFLLGLPKNYQISIKAAIALSIWLLECTTNDVEKEHLYRSFSYIRIYEDRGVKPFNQLRVEPNFRLLNSVQRGKVLALLLSMYKPIMLLKDECAFNLLDKAANQHLVHYTSLNTLKLLLNSDYLPKAESTHRVAQESLLDKLNCEASISSKLKKGLINYIRKEEDSTSKGASKAGRIRLSNCGYMNDVFEGREFLNCLDKIVKGKELKTPCLRENSDKKMPYNRFVELYFPHLERSEDDMFPSSSNVYIVSLSVKEDSFPMWTIYSEAETGCNIEFDDDFYDIHGPSYSPRILQDYLPSRYASQDYPLYIVQYIGSGFQRELESWINATKGQKIKDDETIICKGHRQSCKTESILYQDLCELLARIYLKWCDLEEYLSTPAQINGQNSKEAFAVFPNDKKQEQLIRTFAADRLNEVRFLFKSSDYEFEGEVRIVYTDSDVKSNAKTNYNCDVPRVYVEVDKELKNLTIRLGSKISDATVDQLVTWLKHTGRVKKVELAKRNRYTNQHLEIIKLDEHVDPKI